MDEFDWLQEWYESNCDGDWEHSYGIKADTLDNPGWSVDIDLVDTALEGKPFVAIKTDRSERDWIVCRVRKQVFEGRGGPRNLREILGVFQAWAGREDGPSAADK